MYLLYRDLVHLPPFPFFFSFPEKKKRLFFLLHNLKVLCMYSSSESFRFYNAGISFLGPTKPLTSLPALPSPR